MTIQEVIKNLIGMEVTDTFKDDIICAFEDYNYEGITEVIVTKGSSPNIDYQAYVNHADAPIICIKIADNKVIYAWEA